MTQRPTYPTTTPSYETWVDACAISQQWADSARKAAIKRKQWVHWLSLFLLVVVILALLTLLLLVIR